MQIDMSKLNDLKYHLDKANVEDLIPYLEQYNHSEFRDPMIAATLNARYKELTGLDHPAFLSEQKKVLEQILNETEPVHIDGAPSIYEKLMNNITGKGPGITIITNSEENYIKTFNDIKYDMAHASLDQVKEILSYYDQDSVLISGIETHFRPNVLEAACLNARYKELTGYDYHVFERVQNSLIKETIKNKNLISFNGKKTIYERLLKGDVEIGKNDHVLMRFNEIMENVSEANLKDVRELLNHFNGDSVLINGVENFCYNDPLAAAELNARYKELTGMDHPVFLERAPIAIKNMLDMKDKLLAVGAITERELESLDGILEGKPYDGPTYSERITAHQNHSTPTETIDNQRAGLIQMKDKIQQMKQDPYQEYRDKMTKAFLEEKKPDTMLHSVFNVRDGEIPTCDHMLERISETERQIIQSQTFEYNEQFKKQMLEPSIVDFAKTNPIMESTVNAHNDNQQRADYQAISETNNALSVNNVEPQYANTIDNAVKQIKPVAYEQQLEQQMAQQMEMGGQSLTLSSNQKVGFINKYYIIILIVIILGFVIWAAVALIK